ncbi:hypothetical protein LOKO_02033 [Halomonas chromatireducens]|uniref:Uncharacterized protein n=1 Tax=Halomonas chromatireducens TaxID=507626 RepID=A0A0X8HEL7_9GAMM|nr:hypothetical protein LOKO_02033 [Halomonas chromatireducens]
MKEQLLERRSASRLAPSGASAEAAVAGYYRDHRQHRRESFGLQSPMRRTGAEASSYSVVIACHGRKNPLLERRSASRLAPSGALAEAADADNNSQHRHQERLSDHASPSSWVASSRILNFWILPVTVIGNSSTNFT